MNDSKVQVGLKKLPIHLQSSQNRILIKGGKIVNDDRAFHADVYVEDGIIKQVGTQLTIPGGVRVIDASGKMVIPVDFVNPPKGGSLIKMYDQYREWADPKVCCDYALHVIVPHFDDQVAKEMGLLVKERGVNSFKVFFAYADMAMLEDDEAFNVFRTCKQLGAVAMVHAENGKLIKILQEEVYNAGIHGPEGHLYSRPESAEVEATSRAITLADAAGCPLFVVHVMSALAAEVISQARHNGALVMGEALASALATDGRQYNNTCWRHAAGHVMSPPLRPDPAIAGELMRCLGHGELEITGSDHCVFKADQKALGKDDFRKIPNGVNGVEDRMSVVWEKGVIPGILDPCKFVAVTSTNAAKIFNLYPRKGRIEVGSDADLVIWDGAATRVISASTHHQNVDFNVFEGMCCHGVPITVLSGGRVVMEDGQLHVSQGAGRYLSCAPYPPYVYDRLAPLESARATKPVQREPYTGPISTDFIQETEAEPHTNGDSAKNGNADTVPPSKRAPTCGGGRNMQESSFSLSGAQIDDTSQPRPTIRTKQPPGGASTALW